MSGVTETEQTETEEPDPTFPCRVEVVYQDGYQRSGNRHNVFNVTDVRVIEGRVFNIDYDRGSHLLVPVDAVSRVIVHGQADGERPLSAAEH